MDTERRLGNGPFTKLGHKVTEIESEVYVADDKMSDNANAERTFESNKYCFVPLNPLVEL